MLLARIIYKEDRIMVRDKIRRRIYSPVIVLAGLFAGVVNGLLGAGGGVIMLYLVQYVMGKESESQKDAFASVVAVILPVSIVSAVSYGAAGNIDMSMIQVLAIPALVGGALGAYLTDRLPCGIIRGVFAILLIIQIYLLIF